MHCWDALEPKPETVLHAHYHWLLSGSTRDPNPMLDAGVVGSGVVAAWLARRVPLAPTA